MNEEHETSQQLSVHSESGKQSDPSQGLLTDEMRSRLSRSIPITHSSRTSKDNQRLEDFKEFYGYQSDVGNQEVTKNGDAH